jgi:hypothetical protein
MNRWAIFFRPIGLALIPKLVPYSMNPSARRRSATDHLRDKAILRLCMRLLPTCWKSTAPIHGMAGAMSAYAAHEQAAH